MPIGDPPLTLRELDYIDVCRLNSVNMTTGAQEGLEAAEIRSLWDLLQHYPRRYLDRTRQALIGELEPGDEAVILASVRRGSTRRLRSGRTLTNVIIGDGSGELTLAFFNQPWRERQLPAGLEVVIHGKLEIYRGARQMTSPVIDFVGDQTHRVVPVYPQSEKAGLTTRVIADFVQETLRRCTERGFADPVPDAVRSRYGLVTRHAAIQDIHMPASMADMAIARSRLVFDELLRVQLELVLRKRHFETETVGIAHDTAGKLIERFREKIPFTLTAAQRGVMAEIDADLRKPIPMHRLLQGDVGSGKTLVALHALLVAVQGGHQGALMVPTGVLAEQHHAAVTGLLGEIIVPDENSLIDRPLRVDLLVGRMSVPERRRVLNGLKTGAVDILIGTHALIQEQVEYRSLGVVVIDEQHRFGVEQRAALRQKGDSSAEPDVLVMTATPIPRTAAMTVYGDLDESRIDELPPGRTPIQTQWARTALEEFGVWQVVRDAVAEGRQAYVVCPTIEESTELDLRSATNTFAELVAGELSNQRLGLLHGRVSAADKDRTMEMFRSRQLDVLVATTVIEVGVDVPNATVMVIVDADRFGIAQLHQLRGRVGRGEHPGRCYLLADPQSTEAKARMDALVGSTDGFKLAEVDLEVRGEGTIMGERQRGRNDLRLASLRRDKQWVEKARTVAKEIIEADPDLAHHPQLRDELEIVLRDDDTDFLMKG